MASVKEKQLLIFTFIITLTTLLLIGLAIIYVQKVPIWAILPLGAVDLVAALIGTMVARLIFRAYVSNISSTTNPDSKKHS
jgi:hypothetical protein